MKARWLLRLYPRAWRERYGDEFVALLEARPMGLRSVADVLKAATGEWVGVGRLHVPRGLVTLRTLVGYYCAGHLAWWVLASLLGESPGATAWTPAGLLVSAAIQARAAVVAILVVFGIGWVVMRPYPTRVRSRLFRLDRARRGRGRSAIGDGPGARRCRPESGTRHAVLRRDGHPVGRRAHLRSRLGGVSGPALDWRSGLTAPFRRP